MKKKRHSFSLSRTTLFYSFEEQTQSFKGIGRNMRNSHCIIDIRIKTCTPYARVNVNPGICDECIRLPIQRPRQWRLQQKSYKGQRKNNIEKYWGHILAKGFPKLRKSISGCEKFSVFKKKSKLINKLNRHR